MKKKFFAIITIVALTLSGCAAVCNPQNPGAAFGTGTQIGLVVGLAEFGACSGYYLANYAAGKIVQHNMEKEREETDTMASAVTTAKPVFDNASGVKLAPVSESDTQSNKSVDPT
jgi:hypothetical protein